MKYTSQQHHDSAVGKVLIVDDHDQARQSMADVLSQAGHTVQCCSSAAEALRLVEKEDFDCIVTDLKMPGMTGIEFIIQLEKRQYGAQIVMVTAYASIETAVEAMRHGAFDYIEKPFDVDKLEKLVADAVSHAKLIRRRQNGSNPTVELPHLVGSSSVMESLRQRVRQIAPTSETVLICGETGTGKELVARMIHHLSPRAAAPFISLNCAVLSAQLMESELFGHERGAFTGADTSRVGRFELANGGTILLDEISEIEPPLQAKLLRVLQEKAFERVGSSKTIHVDVRVLATTNRDLPAEIEKGRFRQDLYYRLAVVPITIPPLRERKEDIPELVQYFASRAAERLQRDPVTLTPGAMDLLFEHDWPGNVRELENIITRVSVLAADKSVGADELRRWLIPSRKSTSSDLPIPVGISLQEMERRLIEATLEHFGGHREKTAKALGIAVRTLTGKLRQYGYAPREKCFSRKK